MSASQVISDQQAMAWLSRHRGSVSSVVGVIVLGEMWATHSFDNGLTFTGIILFGLLGYFTFRIADCFLWWNRRRILLASHSLPAPGPAQTWNAMRRERKRIRYVTKQWAAFCTANGITGVGKVVPKLHNVRGNVSGDLTALIVPGKLGVKGAPGMTAVDRIRTLAASIAEVTGCREVLVRNTGTDSAILTFLWTEALERVLPVAQLPVAPKGTIAYGVRRDGRPATITAGLSVLISGMTGSGKALALDTKVPTPSGWTTMGDIKAGDVVFSEAGEPTAVTDAWDVRYDRPCYRLHFSDGSSIVADGDHQWTVETDASRRSDMYARKPKTGTGSDQSAKRSRPMVLTTEQMLPGLRARGGRLNYSVPVASPLRAESAELPLPPYTLGAWLGDGTSKSNGFTTADPEVLLNIEAEGVTTTKASGEYAYGLHVARAVRTTPCSSANCQHSAIPGCDRCGAHLPKNQSLCILCGSFCRGETCGECGKQGFGGILRRLGVLGSKHIPEQYLRASEEQRRALLAGLLDTDGYCTKVGSAEFYNTNERLARDVFHLVATLGYQPRLRSRPAMLNGVQFGTVWTVAFTPADKVFGLARKLARQHVGSARLSTTRRFITAIEPVDSVPVRCIAVAAESHQFLVGEACIATHNSGTTWSLLGDLNRQGIPVDLYASDPKGGIELGVLASRAGDQTADLNVVDYCASADDTKRLIEKVEAAMKARQSTQSGRKWTVDDAKDQPLIILVIDECIEVLKRMKTAGPTNDKAKHLTQLMTILSQGRASGVMVIASTQMAQKEVLGDVRDLFAQRLSLATKTAINTDMVLGDGAEAAGALCSKINDRPGLGYSYDEKSRGYHLFRAAWCDDDDIKRIATGQVPDGMDTGVKGEVNRMVAVYRFLNAESELLYVGITVDLQARWSKHAADKPWWPEVDMSKTKVTWHPSEAAARHIEEREIKTRFPKYNKQHNGANPIAAVPHRPAPVAYLTPRKPKPVDGYRPGRTQPALIEEAS